MNALIELAPTYRGGYPAPARSELAYAYEIACEHIEGLGARPFSRTDLFRACFSMPAVRQIIRHFLALDFIERISEPGARPVLYRVLSHALPTAGVA